MSPKIPTLLAPNPSRGPSQIEFSIAREQYVRLAISDVQGQRVATLVDQVVAPGLHTVHWDGQSASGKRAASGIYYWRLETGGDHIQHSKVLKLR